MELDGGDWMGIVVAGAELAGVGGGVDEVDGDVVGGYKAGEVEELVEMALSYERHHHHYYIGGCWLRGEIFVVAAHFVIW